MMFWGRERLAEGEYEKALAHYNKPKRNNQKVLWHLNNALNLNPTMTEAVELKQRVTNKEVSLQGSGVRGYVSRMILNDRPASAAPAPAPTRTESPVRPIVPANPQATTQQPASPAGEEPAKTDPFANTDWSEEIPLDEVMPEALPEATEPEQLPADQTGAVKWPAPDKSARSNNSEKPAGDESTATDVTEIPVEEIKSDDSSADQNK
jgi:hypothetical protein